MKIKILILILSSTLLTCNLYCQNNQNILKNVYENKFCDTFLENKTLIDMCLSHGYLQAKCLEKYDNYEKIKNNWAIWFECNNLGNAIRIVGDIGLILTGFLGIIFAHKFLKDGDNLNQIKKE